MSRITQEEVEKLAGLARIRLADEEKEQLTHDMGAILEYIAKLNEVSTDGVEPTAQVTGLENILRPDQPGTVLEYPLEDRKSLLLDQAPETHGHYVKVKAILKK